MLDQLRLAKTPEIHLVAAFVAWLAVSQQGFDAGGSQLVCGWPQSPQQLGALFQEFVRRRLEAEVAIGTSVSADTYPLHRVPGVGGAGEILPRLRTDVVLRGDAVVVIVEAKLMVPLEESSRGGDRGRRLRASHLSQLLAYLEHASCKHPGKEIRGALLYGACCSGVRARFPLRAYEVAVVSTDLRKSVACVLSDIADVGRLVENGDAAGVAMGEWSEEV
jgi:hypothetical protein